MKLKLILSFLLLITVINCIKNPYFLPKKGKDRAFQGKYILAKINSQTETKFEGILEFEGDQDYYLSETNKIIKSLKVSFQGNNEKEFTFKINRNDGKPEFELPNQLPFPHEKNTNTEISQAQYSYTVSQVNEEFVFEIFKNGQNMVYSSVDQQLIYSEQFVQIGTQVRGDKLWGWGQRRGVWEYSDGEYTIWNSDNPTQMSTGKAGQQTYGTHPVWLSRQSLGQQYERTTPYYYMAYLRTSQGLLLDYKQTNNMTIKMVSGPIELKYFVYDTPKENIQAYHKYANGWTMQPFYSMGFQICRWGIKNSKKWVQVWEEANKNNISFDVLWSDIDYLQDYEDFTISDKYDVESMKAITDLNDKDGVHWVPIIDAGVGYYSDSAQKGISENIFIKNEDDKDLIGCVWPGPAYFADFNNPNTNQFWIQGLQNITSVFNGPQPSGIWNDMNEPSNFVNGQVETPEGCPPFPLLNQQQQQKLLDNSITNDGKQLPWSPNGKKPLDQRTLSINAKHYSKEDSKYVYIKGFQITEKDFHNMYGFLEGVATREYLEKDGQQSLPYIVTRSSFAGQGRYTQLWTGDNYSSWKQLETSLGDIFNFQIFGIPMVGPDVCGFTGFPTAELCARWYQMGAWYPFYRSHTDHYSPNQYPWSFKDPYVLSSTRDSINIRYSFAKWYYSVFIREQPEGTVFNPLFFEYPEDEMAINEAHQALIGSEIMVTPVLQSGNSDLNITDIKVYMPGDQNTQWYNYLDLNEEYKGSNVYDLSVDFDSICPFFIKSGSIVAQQPQVINTEETTRTRYLNNDFKLIIALDQQLQAKGNILGIDDYNDQQLVKSQCINDENSNEENNCLLNISAQVLDNNRLKISIEKLNEQTFYNAKILISTIQLLGYQDNSEKNVNLQFDQYNTNITINLNDLQIIQ